jgi:hypothetical protein
MYVQMIQMKLNTDLLNPDPRSSGWRPPHGAYGFASFLVHESKTKAVFEVSPVLLAACTESSALHQIMLPCLVRAVALVYPTS